MHDVRLDVTVENFREEYCRKQGTEAQYCRLLFAGKELEDVRNGKGKYKMKRKKWLLLFRNNRCDIYIYILLTNYLCVGKLVMTLKDYGIQNVRTILPCLLTLFRSSFSNLLISISDIYIILIRKIRFTKSIGYRVVGYRVGGRDLRYFWELVYLLNKISNPRNFV